MSTFISLLHEHYQAFVDSYGDRLTSDVRLAMASMDCCRTGHLGHTQWQCSACQHTDRFPMSCGHRACPQCQHRTSVEWLARRQDKQLPVEQFMVTFTLPAPLRPLAHAQPKALYALMCQVAASVMKDFATRKHGGQSGFTLVLHTHSRKRDVHPHIHVVVPAGYYDAARGLWHKGNKGYLYNAFALAKVWRARMLEAINQHPELRLPSRLPDKWVVDCRHIGRGPAVFKYLSRYLYRGVLPDKDIISTENGQVTFRYRESTSGQWRTRRLPVLKFLWLILQHVLPKGFQRVRDYGLMHSSRTLIRLQLLTLLLQSGFKLAPSSTPVRKAQRPCPCCQHMMHCVGFIRPS